MKLCRSKNKLNNATGAVCVAGLFWNLIGWSPICQRISSSMLHRFNEQVTDVSSKYSIDEVVRLCKAYQCPISANYVRAVMLFNKACGVNENISIVNKTAAEFADTVQSQITKDDTLYAFNFFYVPCLGILLTLLVLRAMDIPMLVRKYVFRADKTEKALAEDEHPSVGDAAPREEITKTK